MPAARPVVVLVTGEPIPAVHAELGGYPELIRRAASSAWTGPYLDADLRDGAALPRPDSVAGAVITGSAASVTERAPWMLRGEAYLRDLVGAGVPVFGICFGHQMLAQALGGHVARNPRGREIGTVDVEVVEDDLVFCAGVKPARANMTHMDTVAMLPPGARILAKTAHDAHAALRFTPRTWGVQFHPEMDGGVIRKYVEARKDVIRAEGSDPERIAAEIDDGAFGCATLRAFLGTIGVQGKGSGQGSITP